MQVYICRLWGACASARLPVLYLKMGSARWNLGGPPWSRMSSKLCLLLPRSVLSLMSRSLLNALDGSELMPHPDVCGVVFSCIVLKCTPEWGSGLRLTASLAISPWAYCLTLEDLITGWTGFVYITSASHLSSLSTCAWLRNQETVLGCCQLC